MQKKIPKSSSTKNSTPPGKKIKYNKIPPELRQRDQWICWAYEGTKGKVPKIPGTNNSNASATNSETWNKFEAAYQYHTGGHFNGVGFVLTKSDPYVMIDLDDCRNPGTGVIQAWVKEIIVKLGTYYEASPSGTGIRIIAKGTLPGAGRKRAVEGTNHTVEIFDAGKYYTITGNTPRNAPKEIRECSKEILALYHSLKSDKSSKQNAATGEIKQVSPTLSDENVIKRASEAKNGEKFKRLMAGDSSDYPSDSEADAALAALIGFYTQDFDQILRVIQASGLWDDKWEQRADYRQNTITGALSKLTKHYHPPREKRAASTTQPLAEDPDQRPDQILFDKTRLTPPPGFLRDYMECMTPLSEAPEQFHLSAALVAVSTAVGKRVYYRIINQEKYPNIWIALVGSSGCKKSTAVNTPRRLIKDAGLEDRIFPTQFTPEALINGLSQFPEGAFFWSELGSTMDQWSKKYASDAISLMTDLYDNQPFSRRLTGGLISIPGSSISILSGCTHQWLRESVKETDIAKGYYPRFLFVQAQGRSKYLALPPAMDQGKYNSLIEHIRRIHESIPEKYRQEAGFGKVADLYSAWYEKINIAADRSEDDTRISFVQRLTDYAKKISILLELSSHDRDPEITAVEISPESMEYSIKLVEWLYANTMKVIRQAVGSEMSELEDRVLEFIRRAGKDGVKRRDISHRFSKDKAEQGDIQQALETLRRAEYIEEVRVKPKGRGRPGTKFYLL